MGSNVGHVQTPRAGRPRLKAIVGASMHDDVFEIQRQRAGDHLLLQVHGELDIQTVDRFGQNLAEAGREPRCHVTVDFTGVRFFDALTLGQLASAAAGLRSDGHLVRLRGLSLWQERIVRLCGLDQVMSIV